MASQNVHEFTDANFDENVLQAQTPVLVDFWAEWCAPCRMLAPTIDTIADEFAGKVHVGKVDTDANQQVAVKYGIMSIPTVFIFKDGEIAKKFVGVVSKDELAGALNDIGAG